MKSATASGIAFSYLLCAAISLVALIICIFTVTSRAKEKAARNAKASEAQASAEVAAETTEGQPAEHHYAGAYVAPCRLPVQAGPGTVHRRDHGRSALQLPGQR